MTPLCLENLNKQGLLVIILYTIDAEWLFNHSRMVKYLLRANYICSLNINNSQILSFAFSFIYTIKVFNSRIYYIRMYAIVFLYIRNNNIAIASMFVEVFIITQRPTA